MKKFLQTITSDFITNFRVRIKMRNVSDLLRLEHTQRMKAGL